MRLAFLTDGRLIIVDDDGSSTTHISTFAQSAEKRSERTQQLNDWKSETDSWGAQGAMQMPGMPQFQTAGRPQTPTQFTNISAGEANTVSYSMNVYGAGGLFIYDFDKGYESRLMHANNFHPTCLAANPEDGMLAFSIGNPDGSRSLKVKPKDRPQQRQLTAGDTCDEAPVWRRVEDRDYIYFHSTAVGRNQEGFAIGRGPGSICRIALDEGEVETLLDDEAYDFLQPKFDADGNLYAIRRKYQLPSSNQSQSLWAALMDVVMLPYRILRMLFYLANFLSMMFVGKPLSSDMLASTPDTQKQQQRYVWGQVLRTQKTIRKQGQAKRMRLVPDDWEIVRVASGGELHSIARHVMAFDVGANGAVVYSDGSGVYQVEDGNESQLDSTPNVTQIAILK